MRHIKTYILLASAACLISSCELLMDPLDDNHSTSQRVLDDPAYAEGVLVTAYLKMPTNSYSWNDAATDDAVTNNKTSDFLRMATGQWSASFNPMNRWQSCQEGIQAINHFLTIVEQVNWRQSNPTLNELYIKRFKGECHALRAVLKYHFLVTVAGRANTGQMLGIPLVDHYLEADSDFNIPRATFDQSVRNIYDDIDKALEYLTMDDYGNLTDASQLPPGYEDVGVENYNIVFGRETSQRISGRMAKAMRARVALLAASPAFNNDRQLWEDAAMYAGELLQSKGGVSALDPNGHRGYLYEFANAVNLVDGVDQPEMLWRGVKTNSNTREREHFPPSFFGNGRLNPTQNIVDAFPMQNGYPIDHPLALYDANDPYAGRDPRLSLYILHNGATFKDVTVTTGVGGRENARDSIETSTRTGYYLKKLLVERVSLATTSTSTEAHYEVHMRYTEFFLIYAEAANEAWGPDADPNGYGFTARDVIAALRRRAGISQPDNYLASVTSQAAMREMIRNERRLELCFEGFRFWDLRRWNADLNETARGVQISRFASSYDYVNVEERIYRDYMKYGPIPYNEQVKYNNLVQNAGW